MSLDEVKGYKVITLKYAEERSSAMHYIYAKKHSVRDRCPEKPTDRTIFIQGVPPYCNEDALKKLFGQFGLIKDVFVHSKPTSSIDLASKEENSKYFSVHSKLKGFKVAYIVFDNPSSIEKVMTIDPSNSLILSPSEHHLALGLKKWCKEFNERIPDPDELEKEINDFMVKYDNETDMQSIAEISKGNPDDGGWVTVTRRGRNPGISRKESVNNRIKAIEKKKRSKKELLDFYRFQIKESKMNQLVKLREKFEEDKKKISLIKQTRNFKPFK